MDTVVRAVDATKAYPSGGGRGYVEMTGYAGRLGGIF
jgi:hypothetical protein